MLPFVVSPYIVSTQHSPTTHNLYTFSSPTHLQIFNLSKKVESNLSVQPYLI